MVGNETAVRLATVLCMAAWFQSLTGCQEHPLKSVELESTQEQSGKVQLSINRDVDILFVIDNSRSMGEEQLNLSQNFPRFLSELDRPEVSANYRIAVTTTDNGGYGCETTDSEKGNFVLSSCQSRLDEFGYQNGPNEAPVDQTAACSTPCPSDLADLAVLPTTTSRTLEPTPHPWLERGDGFTNLPSGVSPAQALQCFGPQGIVGCGTEAHLETMLLALTRANTAEQDEYGFIRDGAILAIVFVTDEDDCSLNDAFPSPLDRNGDHTFWPPGATDPTSAICWNAGTRCKDDGTCELVNLGVDGREVADDVADEQAVLRPLSRYIDLVQELEDRKKALRNDQEVIVAAISGVPLDYAGGPIPYDTVPDGTEDDAAFRADFGIAPGCISGVATAVPPSRLRAFAEEFTVEGKNNLFSVCNDDFAPAMDDIVEQIVGQIKPACMAGCVADTDFVAPGLDPSCILTEEIVYEDGMTEERNVPQCDDGELPNGATKCFIPRSDPETMHRDCRKIGNLEFDFVDAPPDATRPRATANVSATCELATNRSQLCPNLF